MLAHSLTGMSRSISSSVFSATPAVSEWVDAKAAMQALMSLAVADSVGLVSDAGMDEVEGADAGMDGAEGADTGMEADK